jgi:hypothetical protein
MPFSEYRTFLIFSKSGVLNFICMNMFFTSFITIRKKYLLIGSSSVRILRLTIINCFAAISKRFFLNF